MHTRTIELLMVRVSTASTHQVLEKSEQHVDKRKINSSRMSLLYRTFQGSGLTIIKAKGWCSNDRKEEQQNSHGGRFCSEIDLQLTLLRMRIQLTTPPTSAAARAHSSIRHKRVYKRLVWPGRFTTIWGATEDRSPE